MGIERIGDIIAWQKAKELTLTLYRLFRENRDFAFRERLQRAAVSVMNNIAEGFERRGKKEFTHFLSIAKGSRGEVRSMIILSRELQYISEHDYNHVYHTSSEVSKILSGLIKSIK